MDDRLPLPTAGGDPPSPDIRQLVADHHAALYRYALHLSGSVHDAEDLTQQAFLVAQTKLDQVRTAACIRSWLYAVLRNAFLRQFRRGPPVLAADYDLDLNDIPDDALAETEVDGERLRIALSGLPDEFRVVLLMFYFEEKSYREIAAALELPLGTVMSRLSRAKGHLRFRLFEPECQPAGSPAGSGAAGRRERQGGDA